MPKFSSTWHTLETADLWEAQQNSHLEKKKFNLEKQCQGQNESPIYTTVWKRAEMQSRNYIIILIYFWYISPEASFPAIFIFYEDDALLQKTAESAHMKKYFT